MKKVYTGMTGLVGHTPLLEPVRFNKSHNLAARLLVKLEYLNPAGSVKDRVALAMIEDAEQQGILQPDSVLIEPTSGNTGIGLAAAAAAKGYRAIFVMPDTMSIERRNLMAAYGAEIVLTEGYKGMTGSIKKAKELAREIPHAFIPGQFTNPVNPRIHEETTGPEIFEDTDGKVDVFLAGVGTGGTLSGIGHYLKRVIPSVRIVAIEPADSPLLSEGHAGPHMLQGIGANFIPDTLDTHVYDDIKTITTEEAFTAARQFFYGNAHTPEQRPDRILFSPAVEGPPAVLKDHRPARKVRQRECPVRCDVFPEGRNGDAGLRFFQNGRTVVAE